MGIGQNEADIRAGYGYVRQPNGFPFGFAPPEAALPPAQYGEAIAKLFGMRPSDVLSRIVYEPFTTGGGLYQPGRPGQPGSTHVGAYHDLPGRGLGDNPLIDAAIHELSHAYAYEENQDPERFLENFYRSANTLLGLLPPDQFITLRSRMYANADYPEYTDRDWASEFYAFAAEVFARNPNEVPKQLWEFFANQYDIKNKPVYPMRVQSGTPIPQPESRPMPPGWVNPNAPPPPNPRLLTRLATRPQAVATPSPKGLR